MSTAGTAVTSVYEQVLGERFAALHPQLQRYFGVIPAGSVGVGTGVYDIAGSRRRFLVPLLAGMAWRHVLFPEYARGVPFGIRNTPGAGGTLSARRTFDFSSRRRIMEDTMRVEEGVLVDALGRRRGLEVDLHLSVRDGSLRMTSGCLRLRVGQARLPLPQLVRLTLVERPDPSRDGAQRVDRRMTAPLLGEVFRYAGTFDYAIEPAP